MTTTQQPTPEPVEPDHRELRAAPAPPTRALPDRTRAGVRRQEVASAIGRDGYAVEAVRPVSAEAAAMWDAALWHRGARR